VLRGAKWAGREAVAASAAGAKWAREHGSDLIDQIPTDRIEREVRETVGEARDRINGFVQHELRDLRKAIRRQRRRLGV
jgi:pyruvate/2-oxoglutarate dehydrogenase complex dihydrolipoamide acyltransferase (E2) component